MFARATSPLCRDKRSYPTLALLCLVFCAFAGTSPAHAQETAGGSVTVQRETTRTVAVGTPVSITATATPSPPPAGSTVSGLSYTWADYQLCSPPAKATTTYTNTFSVAGTYTATMSCHFHYSLTSSNGTVTTVNEHASPPKPVTIYVIGGPISGDKDVRYYCDYPTEPSPLSADETGHLSAASRQVLPTVGLSRVRLP